MLRIYLRIVIAILLLQLGNGSIAQNNLFATKAFVKNNKVILRWATTDKKLWDAGVKSGYIIERIQVNSPALPEAVAFHSSTEITTPPIKPASAKDTLYWKNLLQKFPNAALLYGLLYPDTASTHNNLQENIKTAKLLLGYALIACDQSAEVAKAAGLYFTDTTVNNNNIYAYRIRFANANDSNPNNQIILVVDARQVSELPKIDSVSVRFKNKKVSLRWNVANNKNDYSAYVIERSSDSITFINLTKAPYVLAYTEFEKVRNHADFTDTVLSLGKTYFYRIRGITHFGEQGPASNIVRLKTKIELSDFPVIDSALSINPKQSIIYWKMEKSTDIKTLKGFAIARSLKADGHYTFINNSLISKTKKSFIDTAQQYINYYKVYAVSVDDDSTSSFPVMMQPEDQEPPCPPKNLSGVIDSMGVVRLKWNANAEIDLMGYRIYRGNTPGDEFVEVSKIFITDTVFVDTININTLNKNIYYSLTAVDFTFNNSDYSSTLKLNRPDIIAPTPALFNGISFNQSGVILKWINSSSEDIMQHTLERNDKSFATQKAMVKTWFGKDTSSVCVDTAVVEHHLYQYTLTVRDSSGNRSQVISSILKFEPGIQKKVSKLSGASNRTDRKIELHWQYSALGVQHFILYKAKKGEQLRTFKILPHNVSSFVDTQISINTVYLYALKAVYTSGTESELSDVIEVNY